MLDKKKEKRGERRGVEGYLERIRLIDYH